MPVITVDACAGYAYTAGFRGEALATIVAIAGPESGYNTGRLFDNPKSGDLSYGLWQINMLGTLGPARRKQFGLSSNEALFDPRVNARAAWAISSGGSNFNPWTTYKKGLHRSYLAAARAAADSVTARAGGAVAAGSIPLELTGGELAGEVLPPAGNLGFGIANVSTVFPRIGLNGVTVDVMERVARMGVSGTVSLSATSVAQVVATYADPLGAVQTWQHFLSLSDARLGDLRLTVAATEWVDLDDVPGLQVTFRPVAVDGLRGTDPQSPSVQWANLSPTEVLAERARFVGLRFYGKETPRRASITRLGYDDAGKQLAESDWEMGQRFAKEEGFWFFESADALYFAPPSWLWLHGTSFDARFGSSVTERIWEVLAIPSARTSVDESVYGKRAIGRTMTLQMPRWRGEQVRPGMHCVFKGIPGYEAELYAPPGFPAQWVVTEVNWALDGGITPVEVQLVEAIDPIPQPPSDAGDLGDGAGGPGAGAAGSSSGVNFPTGTGVSNQGKGSYGYQYDPVGSTPATGPQPGATVLMTHLTSKFKGSSNSGIFSNRNVDGSSSLSVHAEGRAGDTGVPVSSALGTSIADYLVAHASLFGIQYIIWNGRSWSSQTRAWKTYKPPNGKTDNTSMHRDHVHWELCWEAARYLNAAAINGAIAHSGPGDTPGAGGGGGSGSW